jgi:hypothetical protein
MPDELETIVILKNIHDELEIRDDIQFFLNEKHNSLLHLAEGSPLFVDFYVAPTDGIYNPFKLNQFMKGLIKSAVPIEVRDANLKTFAGSSGKNVVHLNYGHMVFVDYPAVIKEGSLKKIRIDEPNLFRTPKNGENEQRYELFTRGFNPLTKYPEIQEKRVKNPMAEEKIKREIRIFVFPYAEIAKKAYEGTLNPRSFISDRNLLEYIKK